MHFQDKGALKEMANLNRKIKAKQTETLANSCHQTQKNLNTSHAKQSKNLLERNKGPM